MKLKQAVVGLGLISYWAGAYLATMDHTLAEMAKAPASSLPQQAEEVASFLEGQMDTSVQAGANPKAPNVRMTTCRVQVTDAPTDPPSIFLYQEQALIKNPGQPYRQRFLQISPHDLNQTVRSLTFKPTHPATWIGFCNQPITSRVIQARDLGSSICSVFLRGNGHSYIGHTPITGCPTNVRGAIRMTNRIELNSVGMNTWDRGYNAAGQQVWGAQSESYQYRRPQ
jgi:hypothetical protein